MKSITLSEFMNTLPAVLSGVTDGGDIVRVQTEGHGAFVVMEEAEYKILRDALKAVFIAAGSVEKDEETIKVSKLLAKLSALGDV